MFIFSGLTAGIAALLSLGYYGGATSGDGQGYEFERHRGRRRWWRKSERRQRLGIGGIARRAGHQMISTGIVILGINQNYSQIIIGAVVILAVVLDQFNNWLAKRRLTKAG